MAQAYEKKVKNKHRIVDPRRFIAALLSLVFIISVILVITVFAAEKRSLQETEGIVYFVSQGDTLWDIAIRNKGETEIRTYIYKLRKLNRLDTSDLQIGQKLKLP